MTGFDLSSFILGIIIAIVGQIIGRYIYDKYIIKKPIFKFDIKPYREGKLFFMEGNIQYNGDVPLNNVRYGIIMTDYISRKIIYETKGSDTFGFKTSLVPGDNITVTKANFYEYEDKFNFPLSEYFTVTILIKLSGEKKPIKKEILYRSPDYRTVSKLENIILFIKRLICPRIAYK